MSARKSYLEDKNRMNCCSCGACAQVCPASCIQYHTPLTSAYPDYTLFFSSVPRFLGSSEKSKNSTDKKMRADILHTHFNIIQF